MTGPSIQWRFVASTVGRYLLPLWFAIYALLVAEHYGRQGLLFVDVALYRDAAIRALSGQDPWQHMVGGLAFAGPPPTLLLYFPLAFVPQDIAVVIVPAILLGAAIWSIRRLELPLWWVLFPPVFEGMIVGNPDVLVLALLLVRGPLAGLAAVVKVYAIVPLALQRRWGALVVAFGVSALTLPLWPAFLTQAGAVVGTLDVQSQGFSAWGSWLMLPTLVALVALRRKGAEWLVVPAIWPHTQLHYAAMSLPVVRHYPVGAALIGLAPPLGVMAIAIEAYIRRDQVPGAPQP